MSILGMLHQSSLVLWQKKKMQNHEVLPFSALSRFLRTWRAIDRQKEYVVRCAFSPRTGK